MSFLVQFDGRGMPETFEKILVHSVQATVAFAYIYYPNHVPF